MSDEDPEADVEEGPTAVARSKQAAKAVQFALVVLDGPEQGQRYAFDAAHAVPVLVGVSASCDLRLSDREASRRHAELYQADGRLRIRDLGSTNGTFVNDLLVLEAFLTGGERVRVGTTTLRVDRVEERATASQARSNGFGRFVGASPEMQRLYPLIHKLAQSDVPVLIEGETGTGKEVLAEAMHEASPRSGGPFVVFDCTAVPASLVESELFGHERGAFTGALAGRRGLFEQAHGGTLLIDEIGDLDLALQPKLLRAIDRSEVKRLGAERPQVVDVRILLATRRDLDREVQAGRFRDDLFHRVSVGRIVLPPLRRRKGDVALLAAHFWSALGGKGKVPPELLERWAEDSWSGNTRELRNAVARRLAVGDADGGPAEVVDEEAPAEAAPGNFWSGLLQKRLPLPVARLHAVQEFERRYVEQVLAEHDGSIQRAADASGIGRRYFQMLRRKLRER